MQRARSAGLRVCLCAPQDVRDIYLPRILSGQINACTALTEPGARSDVATLSPRADQGPEGRRISGEQTWIVNGARADLPLPPGQASKTILTDINAAHAYVAAMCCAAVTARSAIVTLGQTRAGDRVLVQGTGGVGLVRAGLCQGAGCDAHHPDCR